MSVRDQFSVADVLGTVCHDVRGALAVTVGAVNELATEDYGPLSAQQQQFVAMIRRGNGRLARLGQTLGYLTELWEGTLEVRRAACDLPTLVRSVLDEAVEREPASRAQRSVEVPALPVFAAADPEHARFVLGSLIGVAVSAARRQLAVRIGTQASMAWVEVEDDGPARAAGRSTSGTGVSSTGLCYAVCGALVAAQGGDLEVHSPLDKDLGCRVRVTMPAAPPPA